MFLRRLCWILALFNFCLKACHISGSVNVQADHVFCLYDFVHFLAYCCILEKHSIDSFPLPACNHVSLETFQFHLRKYSQPPKFCLLYILFISQFACMYAANLARFLLPHSVNVFIHFVGLLHKNPGLPNNLSENLILSSVLKGMHQVYGPTLWPGYP